MAPQIQPIGPLIEEAKVHYTRELNGIAKAKPSAFNFSDYEIDDGTEIPPFVPVVTITDTVFAYKGDISFVAGPPKSGKSTVSINMLATALMPDVPPELDTLGIRSSYCEERTVLYVDTEQPKVFTDKIRSAVLRLAGLSSHPDHFKVFNIRTMPHKERLAFLLEGLKHFNKAHMWILDGITDFLVEGANSEAEGNTIIQILMAAASANDTCIICMIHHNRSSDNLRGHIGAESERKSGGVISIGKDKAKQVHWIEAKYLRGSRDFEKVFFQFSDKENRFMSCDVLLTQSLRKEISPEDKKRAALQQLAAACLLGKTLTREDLKKEIINRERGKKDGTAISDKTAGRRLEDMEEEGFIVKLSEGYYTHADQGKAELELYGDDS